MKGRLCLKNPRFAALNSSDGCPFAVTPERIVSSFAVNEGEGGACRQCTSGKYCAGCVGVSRASLRSVQLSVQVFDKVIQGVIYTKKVTLRNLESVGRRMRLEIDPKSPFRISLPKYPGGGVLLDSLAGSCGEEQATPHVSGIVATGMSVQVGTRCRLRSCFRYEVQKRWARQICNEATTRPRVQGLLLSEKC